MLKLNFFGMFVTQISDESVDKFEIFNFSQSVNSIFQKTVQHIK